jgi:hypothetical protein
VIQVALVAAEFFSGSYLPALKAVLPPLVPGSNKSSAVRAAVLEQHSPVLQQLIESLVLRTQLRPEVAVCATADARDIPDDARTVSALDNVSGKQYYAL